MESSHQVNEKENIINCLTKALKNDDPSIITHISSNDLAKAYSLLGIENSTILQSSIRLSTQNLFNYLLNNNSIGILQYDIQNYNTETIKSPDGRFQLHPHIS